MALGIDIALCAERFLVEIVFRTLIDDGAALAREWHAIGIAFEKILTHLGADFFKEEPKVPDDWIVAEDGMALLLQIMDAGCYQHDGNQQEHHHPSWMVGDNPEARDAEEEQDYAQCQTQKPSFKNLTPVLASHATII